MAKRSVAARSAATPSYVLLWLLLGVLHRSENIL